MTVGMYIRWHASRSARNLLEWFSPKTCGSQGSDSNRQSQRQESLSAETSPQSKHLVFKSFSEPQFTSLENVGDRHFEISIYGLEIWLPAHALELEFGPPVWEVDTD